jgi:mttA/Hcf106 family
MFEGLFQPMHLLVIFGIALLVFGPKKLPELGAEVQDSSPSQGRACDSEWPRIARPPCPR